MHYLNNMQKNKDIMIKLKKLITEDTKQPLNEDFVTTAWMLVIGKIVFGGAIAVAIKAIIAKNIFKRTWQWFRPGALKKALKDPEVLAKTGISDDVAEKAIQELERNPSLITKLQAEVQKELLKQVKKGKVTVDQAYAELQGYYTTAAEKEQLRKNLELIYPKKSTQGKVGKKYLNPKHVMSFKLADPAFTQQEFDLVVRQNTHRGSRLGDMYSSDKNYARIYTALQGKIKSKKVDIYDITSGRKRYVMGIGTIPVDVVNKITDYTKLKGWLKNGLDLKDTTLMYKGWEDAAWKSDIASQMRNNGIRWSAMPIDQQNRLSRLMWYLIKNKPMQAGQTVSWG